MIYSSPVRSISVIVPALNEEATIARCLESLMGERFVAEIIVADGGSRDGTIDVALDHGVRVLQTPRGRGYQIERAVQSVSGDVVLILHADCFLRSGVARRIVGELNRRRDYIGGALGMEYFQRSRKLRMLEILNNVRAEWTGISFGDQGQFFRREALSVMGGYPHMMIMEDVELAMRLNEHGPTCFIASGVIVSARRWEAQGFYRHALRVLCCCSAFFLQRTFGMGDPERRDFQIRYYGPE